MRSFLVHESVNPDNKVCLGTKCNLLQVSHAASLPTHPAGNKPETWRQVISRAHTYCPLVRHDTGIINCFVVTSFFADQALFPRSLRRRRCLFSRVAKIRPLFLSLLLLLSLSLFLSQRDTRRGADVTIPRCNFGL